MSDVIHLRPEGEVYINSRELCSRLNIGRTKLHELIQEGLPSYTWGLRVRRFKFSEVERWLRGREKMVA